MTKVLIRPTSDSNTREYHISEQSETPYQQVLDTEMETGQPALHGFAKDTQKAITGSGGNSGRNQGIEKMTFREGKSFKVTKQDSASWTEVEPQVLKALRQQFKNLEVQHYSTVAAQAMSSGQRTKVPA